MRERQNVAGRREAGVAAIEFALVLPILVLVFFGLVTFGSALYTQMVVSRAAEDGVRAVSFLTSASSYANVPESVKTAVKTEVINSLANSTIAAGASNGSYAARQTWLQNNVLPQIVVDNGNCGGTATATNTLRVNVRFPYSSARILPSIDLPPFGSFSSWMPTTLTGCAMLQL
jgi:Flp pilus assembly protein TadG